MIDRFGPVPPPVEGFIRTMRMKLRAAPWGLASISPGKEGMIAKYRDRKKAEELRRRDPRAVRIMDEETILLVGENVVELLRRAPPGK